MRILAITVAAIALLVAGLYVAFRTSPWPSLLLVRYAFDRGAADASKALEPFVPASIAARLDQRYGNGPDEDLDIFFPSDASPATRFTTIVWIHGGGFISGSKRDIDNYAKILAARGFAVASIGYTIAPAAKFPTPIVQANDALRFLVEHAGAYHIDTRHLVLAGDSGGAMDAAQLANVISEPSYAQLLKIVPAVTRRELAGALLFCGPYDATTIRSDGSFGGFLSTVLWAYGGDDEHVRDAMSVAKHVNETFPPSFISAGNADPLAPQSYAFADALRKHGVAVDTLFFPRDHQPELQHEFQFSLQLPDARVALDRATAFLRRLNY